MNTIHHCLLLLCILIFAQSCVDDSKDNEEQEDFRVVIRQEQEIESIHPMLSRSGYASQIYQHIFFPLTEFSPTTLKQKPALAKAMPEVHTITDGPYEGGTAFTYEILEEATWDDGTPITGKDYEFTLKAVFNPMVKANSWRGYLKNIREVSIDPQNPKKFTVYTHPYYFIITEIVGNFSIYPKHHYDPNGLLDNIAFTDLTNLEKKDSLIKNNPNLKTFADAFSSEKYLRDTAFVSGSGPYRLAEWKSGQYIMLKRKKDWWGDKLTENRELLQSYPDEMVFMPISDINSAIAKLKDEGIDVMRFSPGQRYIDLKENATAKENYNFYNTQINVVNVLFMNNKSPLLSDKKVRQAVAHLFDVQKGIKDIVFGMGTPVIGPIHPMSPYYHKDLDPVPYSVEKARTLLAEAGWKDTNNNGIVDKVVNGQRQELTLRMFMGPASELAQQIAAMLQAGGKQIGINIEVVKKDMRAIINDHLRPRDYELVALRVQGSPAPYDPYQRWHTDSDRPDGSNFGSFGNAASDKLIEQIRETKDREELIQLYKEFQELLYEEQGAVFLFAPEGGLAVHKRLDAKTSNRRPGFFPNTFRLKGE